MIVTDAWFPQTNGVVQTLARTGMWLDHFGHEVKFVTPERFRSFACPTYPEIRLAWRPYSQLADIADAFEPEAIHVATEGSLGFAARRYCIRRRYAFTTSYHTQFPHYLHARMRMPRPVSYQALRWFHGAAERCMVSTESISNELASHGFRNIARWRRGVDTQLFHPRDKAFLDLPRPIATYVGRLAVEKNVEAFLSMKWQGSKLVIGDGPERERLKRAYPEATFVGYRFGEDLAAHLAASDVMVFPSLTDTFGLVNLEAMACGVPVAAFPVAGPRDVVRNGVTGILDNDLALAASKALLLKPDDCRSYALKWGWDVCSRDFERNLMPTRAYNARGVATGPAQLSRVSH